MKLLNRIVILLVITFAFKVVYDTVHTIKTTKNFELPMIETPELFMNIAYILFGVIISIILSQLIKQREQK
ncbi:hypothetical protein [Bacillus thuringiensis]|uniref:hypothetical protein n=1 Tax=Bacillus thuringiensis TaxID=1428 RepID=UPI0021D681D5|nr:hypothetical protein [Bacillus thuringiensis]MCU7667361.1 hypothetical protein [Bacillus thuringiensis]